MSFIVLQPNSNTNPTDKFLVVDGAAWMSFINGAQNKGYAIVGEYDTYDSAERKRDELNVAE